MPLMKPAAGTVRRSTPVEAGRGRDVHRLRHTHGPDAGRRFRRCAGPYAGRQRQQLRQRQQMPKIDDLQEMTAALSAQSPG